jgi:hypothetical protein
MAGARQQPDLTGLVERATVAALDAARDVTEVAVGLGILGVNRVQALRRQTFERVAEARRPAPTRAPVDDPA